MLIIMSGKATRSRAHHTIARLARNVDNITVTNKVVLGPARAMACMIGVVPSIEFVCDQSLSPTTNAGAKLRSLLTLMQGRPGLVRMRCVRSGWLALPRCHKIDTHS